MSRVHDISVRLSSFVAILDLKIAEAIMLNDEQLTDMNKEQMLKNVDSENKPLINARTGSQLLSTSYAKRKQKVKPNLFDTGEFQKNMFFNVNENDMTYFITSDDVKTSLLTENYGIKIFGIYDKEKAKQLNWDKFKQLFNAEVMQR